MFNRFQTHFSELIGQKMTRVVGQPAIVGDMSGVVNVPGRGGYIYVRTPGGMLEVFNNRVSAVSGMQVLVGYDPLQPGLLQVLSTQTAQPMSGAGDAPIEGGGYAPASRYSWMHPDGGEDPVYIQLRQFMPLRVKPAGQLRITVYRGYLPLGTPVDTQTLDLTAHVPGESGKVRLVLIYVDSSGAVHAQAGSLVNLAALDYSDIPEPPADAVLCLAAVRLRYGQAAIIEARSQTDILDLRFPYWHKHDLADLPPAREAAQDSYGAVLTDSGGIDIVYVEVA